MRFASIPVGLRKQPEGKSKCHFRGPNTKRRKVEEAKILDADYSTALLVQRKINKALGIKRARALFFFPYETIDPTARWRFPWRVRDSRRYVWPPVGFPHGHRWRHSVSTLSPLYADTPLYRSRNHPRRLYGDQAIPMQCLM